MNRRTLAATATLAALLGAAGAASASTLNQVLDRNGIAPARIAADAARGTLTQGQAASLEQRTARLCAEEARMLAQAGEGALRRIEHEQSALLHAAARVAPRARAGMSALSRMHLRVAATRQAEQQRWVAREFRSGKLKLGQVAQIEAGQARIAQLQASLDRGGRETVAQALRVQHLQDVQDWAIRTGHAWS